QRCARAWSALTRAPASAPSRSAVCIGTATPTNDAARTASSSRRSTARSTARASIPAAARNPSGEARCRGWCPSSYVEIRSTRAICVLLGFGRDVVGRERRPLAEEVLLDLLAQDLLRLGRHEVEPVLVDQHLRVLEPHQPRLLRDVVVDALAELVLERLPPHAGELLAQLHALDHSCHLSLLPIPYTNGPLATSMAPSASIGNLPPATIVPRAVSRAVAHAQRRGKVRGVAEDLEQRPRRLEVDDRDRAHLLRDARTKAVDVDAEERADQHAQGRLVRDDEHLAAVGVARADALDRGHGARRDLGAALAARGRHAAGMRRPGVEARGVVALDLGFGAAVPLAVGDLDEPVVGDHG